MQAYGLIICFSLRWVDAQYCLHRETNRQNSYNLYSYRQY